MEEHQNETFGINGGENEIGVRTVTVPYMAPTLEECFSVARGRIVAGLPEKSRSFAAYTGVMFQVMVIYEGQENPTTNPTLIQYSLRGSFEEEPIEAHPDIQEIKKKYGGYVKEGRIIFPETYAPTEDGNGLPGVVGKDVKKNPLFGVEKYKKLGVVWQRTYAAPGIPGGILDRVGKIVDSPPGAPPELRGRTKWLVLAPNTNQRGNVIEITEEYQLLDEDIAPEIHKTSSIG